MEGRDYLRHPIQLTEAVKRAIEEADSFKQECSDVGSTVDRIGILLRKAARLSTNPAGAFYEHPTRRMMDEAKKTMEKTLALVRKCKKGGVLKRVITITSATDFQKINRLLLSTTEDLNWLLTISSGRDDLGGMPPIAANDPILAMIWQQIARVQAGIAEDKADAASTLASLAQDNERNGKIIIDEGGLPPLMKLLQEGTPAGQENAAKALGELARDQQRAQEIVKAGAIQAFVHVLSVAPVKVQTQAARAMAAIVSHDTDARSAFGNAQGIRLLVALINDTIDETSKTSMHTVVKTRMAQQSRSLGSPGKPWHEEGGGGGGGQQHSEDKPSGRVASLGTTTRAPNSHARTHSSENGKSYYHGSSLREKREREHEDPEVIYQMRAEVLRALWKLATNNIKNCKSITDTRALLCFAKLMEKEGEVQKNAVMAVCEIAAVAEHDQELRRAAFKMTSPAVRAVIEQLLKVIQSDDPDVQIPAMRAIGCLARIFPSKETHIVKPITDQLAREITVASEAAAALLKFTVAENYLKDQHSRSILEANGASHLVQLTYFPESAYQPVVLLCNLTINAGDHPALKSPDVLKAMEAASRSSLMQIPAVREILPKAIEHLELFKAGEDGAQPVDEFDNF
ncbi:hypothetical protein SELMODRAFT_117324 [Selaginella moellendorffii]|uniref:DUF7792 domain-containing protein n=1 Tax=Selaginella moellendorffii TaxID=88036 RepID=D8SHP3_SELML|nr:uncharacterized protein LOC9662330 [Selaginella moellendorffii]EFJ16149.1 hypothetical protein SELMODRAFT_117324 [Selaginella moellendorffii]|eukprot:XP_002982904.1 uncharacterized protein LOC9662330 [Selaginella moellendorffii]